MKMLSINDIEYVSGGTTSNTNGDFENPRTPEQQASANAAAGAGGGGATAGAAGSGMIVRSSWTLLRQL
ncbi:hypothetical protein GFGA_2c0057 (plasmid) [Gluconobacter frateurii NBRC 103465]|nr:hypothetical protein GFGA_2c0057 [Gluconobacter frateurii NBRC 103465]